MPDKPSDIKLSKNLSLTRKGKIGEVNHQKHKQTFILDSFGLHAFNSSVQHFAQWEEDLGSRTRVGPVCPPGVLSCRSAQLHRTAARPAVWTQADSSHLRGRPQMSASRAHLHLLALSTTVPFSLKVHTAGNGRACSEDCYLSGKRSVLNKKCLPPPHLWC